jgi:hypothetical protein
MHIVQYRCVYSIIYGNDTFCTYKDQNDWCNIFAKCTFSIIISLRQQFYLSTGLTKTKTSLKILKIVGIL